MWIRVEEEKPQISDSVLAYGTLHCQLDGYVAFPKCKFAALWNGHKWKLLEKSDVTTKIMEVTHWFRMTPDFPE